MLWMFALAHSGQVQTRRPFLNAGDHDSGGGVVGVGVWHTEQSVTRRSSFISSG
ncbi:MAG: hypothetical protein QG622_1538 [Actinomycetota bacterium]|nr:hypothetical protein [Actinomycetota bacterium]